MLKNIIGNCITVFGMAASIVVGFEVGEKIVKKMNKKEQTEIKETPEIEVAQ